MTPEDHPNVPMTTHPSLELLSGYVDGTLPPDQAETVAQHVSACDTCEYLLAQLEAEPEPFLKSLRVLADPAPAVSDALCQHVVQRISEVTPDPELRPAGGDVSTAVMSDLEQLGPYQLLEKLGEGGMGAVYKARHVKLDKIVAL